LYRKGDGEEVFGSRVRLLEVDDLRAAAAGEITGELEEGTEASNGHEEADDPVDEGEPDRTGVVEDIAG
jgi:hypothetical protein